jgi:hypothetical protein
MNIINIDSAYDLSPAHVGLVGSVLSRPVYGSDVAIYTLTQRVPIVLLSPASMPDPEGSTRGRFKWPEPAQKTDRKPPKNDEPYGRDRENGGVPGSEWLGFYSSNFPIIGRHIPAIGLCPERLMGLAENEDELVIFIAKVLVHEFAHALMDPGEGYDYPNKDDFYVWMEESMANLITLQFFGDLGHHRLPPRLAGAPRAQRKFAHAIAEVDVLSTVRTFIQQQPPPYRLALDLEREGVRSWQKWRDKKTVIAGRTAEKQAWMHYVTTHVGTAREADLTPLYNALFAP